jgi:hypothetical protein
MLGPKVSCREDYSVPHLRILVLEGTLFRSDWFVVRHLAAILELTPRCS